MKSTCHITFIFRIALYFGRTYVGFRRHIYFQNIKNIALNLKIVWYLKYIVHAPFILTTFRIKNIIWPIKSGQKDTKFALVSWNFFQRKNILCKNMWYKPLQVLQDEFSRFLFRILLANNNLFLIKAFTVLPQICYTKCHKMSQSVT